MTPEVIEVAAVAADKIVDHANRKARAQQHVHHVAADETGTAGDDRSRLRAHAALSLFNRRTL
jgi:hypothetical protein